MRNFEFLLKVFGDKDVISISWRYEEIKEILKRRYSLQVFIVLTAFTFRVIIHVLSVMLERCFKSCLE